MILDYLNRVNNALELAIGRADTLQQKQELLMKTAADFLNLIAKMDTETTRIGDKFTELFDKLKNGGLTPEQEAEVFAAGEALSARLAVLGHDPENPVPAE